MECPRWLTYCGLMPTNLITLAHFLVSPGDYLPKSVAVPAIFDPSLIVELLLLFSRRAFTLRLRYGDVIFTPLLRCGARCCSSNK
jgi:hypothetical protein